MNNIDDISEAQKKLTPLAFYLRQSNIYSNDKFNPASFDLAELSFQFTRNPLDLNEAEFESDAGKESDKKARLYIYRHELCLRAFYSKDKESVIKLTSEGQDAKKAGLIQFEFQAIYESRYVSEQEINGDVAMKFGEVNVPFNLWSFWREYIHNTSLRMGFSQPAFLPLFQPIKK